MHDEFTLTDDNDYIFGLLSVAAMVDDLPSQMTASSGWTLGVLQQLS